jgi:multiple RNA-binding domain-containing protein 1
LGEHGRLFVRNLPFSVTEDELRGVFERFGEVAEVSVPMDAHTRRGKGFAHVRYARPEHAVSALSELDGAVFQGRLLHLMPARESAAERRRAAAAAAANGSVGAAGKGAAYKEQKEAAIKAKATDATNWNALFMRPDAVGDAMASRYGVAKADFLDPSADTSMAVRLAQGETHLIGQSTAWLAEHGVDLEALQRAVQGDGGPRGGANGGASAGGTQRSKLLILVKNLSTDVTEDELVTLFGRYGQLGAVLLTPARTLALVEFLEVGEARKAFRAVAYTKLHGVPLYLEWAPVGVLGSKGAAAEPTAPAEPIAPAAAKAGVVAAGAAGGEPEETVDADDTEGRTVFVKNLSFGSTKEDLEALFGRRYGVRAATVVTKPDPKSSNAKRLSMGYGFVEFKTAAHAQAALREMAGARLHEHVLQLKLSTRTTATATGAAAASSKGKKSKVAAGAVGGAGGGASMEPSAKLLVRNLPFQASQKEIKELFQTFGQLKTVRVPKKFDGHHRGFAFVEFVSKAEASKAKNALHATHLYGRHLVLEYAEEERSVEAMREKLRGQQAAAADEESAGGAKRKKRKGADGEGEGLLDDLDL